MTIKKSFFALLAAVMLCGMSGCAKEESSDILQSIPESTTENYSDVQSEQSGSQLEFNFDEAVKNITIFDSKISLPCTIKDFGENFSLNDRVTPISETDYAVCQLFYKNKIVGQVTLSDWSDGENQDEKPIMGFRIGFGSKMSFNDDDMRTQYYDSLNYYGGELEMNVANMTYSSSSADVITILGEPTEKEVQDDGTEKLFYQYSDEKRYIRVVFYNGGMIDFYFNIG